MTGYTHTVILLLFASHIDQHVQEYITGSWTKT